MMSYLPVSYSVPSDLEWVIDFLHSINMFNLCFFVRHIFCNVRYIVQENKLTYLLTYLLIDPKHYKFFLQMFVCSCKLPRY